MVQQLSNFLPGISYRFVIDDHPVFRVVVVDPDAGVNAALEHERRHRRGHEADTSDVVLLGTHEKPVGKWHKDR